MNTLKTLDLNNNCEINEQIMSDNTKTVVRTFDSSHSRPDGKTNYFIKPKHDARSQHVNVVIPFFNEQKKELKRSLESIYDQEQQCLLLEEEFSGAEFHYVTVMDGFYKASESMVDYICEMFGDEWTQDFNEGDTDDCTKIIQKVDSDGNIAKVKVGEGKFLNLSVIVKKQNRKKPNSHEWFFRAYIPSFNGEYAFTTDCGTLYAKNCVRDLICYLKDHEDVSAVTGRQRVMSSDMQNVQSEGLLAMWYRAAQAYDYEASISAFQGAFSLCGMLPVLPGPCGMFRVSDIVGPCLDYYMHFINNTGAENGLAAGNLMLAEDRILSYAAALKTGKYTRWVPSAIFYFEAETDSEMFLAQRRRWTNGTLFCYLYLLFIHPNLIFKAPKHGWFFKFVIYIQILIQCLLYCITAFAPAIFITLCYFSFLNLNISGEYSNVISYSILGIYLSLYTVFCLGHFLKKFIKSLYNFILCWNTVMFFFIMAISLTTFINENPLGMVVLVLSLGFPFILAILHSIDVFVMMLFNFLPFFLFLPTFVPWFMAYSFSRTWDLSWGNRPSNASVKEINTRRSLKIKSFVLLLAIMFANYGVVVGFIMVDNLTTLIYVSVGIISISVAQQILSFFYYLFYNDHTMSSVFDKFKKSHIKYVSSIMFAATLALLFSGVFTTHWLTNSIDVYVPTYQPVILNITKTIYDNGNNLKPNETIVTPYTSEIETQIYSLTTEIVYSSTKLHYITLDEVVTGGFTVTTYYNDTTGYSLINTTGLKENKFENISFSYKYLYKKSSGGGSTYIDKSPATDEMINNITTIPQTYTSTVVKYTADLFSKPNMGKLNINYGILMIEYKFDYTTRFLNETSTWGSNILWDTPNKTWSFTLILFFSACIMLTLNFLSILYSFCVKEKSRVYGIAVIYTWLGVISLMAAIILFPLSWASLTTYHIGWWNGNIPSEVNVEVIMNSSNEAMKQIILESNTTLYKMCGDSSVFNIGDCSLGYSYILVIVSFATALLSYNCLRFALSKKYSKTMDDDVEATIFKERKDSNKGINFKFWSLSPKSNNTSGDKVLLSPPSSSNDNSFCIDSDEEEDFYNRSNITSEVL